LGYRAKQGEQELLGNNVKKQNNVVNIKFPL
jgi:hypothetical protein